MNDEKAKSAGTLQKSLPSAYYLSDEIYAREREAIFYQEWFCAGRAEQLPNPGDHLVLEIAGENILVVRTKEGELRAHYNVCRHRGARLCEPPREKDAETARLSGGVLGPHGIRCPYHQWTYGLDGKLMNAPHLSEGEDICKEELSLYPVGVECWGGFFFLNLSPELAVEKKYTLAVQVGEVPERVKRYPLDELRSAERIVYDVAANWKVIVENYNECYHCGGVHPELCDIVPAFRQQGGKSLDWERGVPHRAGATTFTLSGTTKRASFAGLNEDEQVRHKGELIYPNFMLSLAADHVAAFSLWPLGPQRTRVVCDFLFHPDEITKPDFNSRDAVEFWDLISRQDWEICQRVQEGMNSRRHKFGYYAPMEDLSLDIRRYVMEKLGLVK